MKQPLMHVSNEGRSLLSIYRKFEYGFIKIPAFQRNFVWDKGKIAGWAQSILDQNALGVIVTYQLVSDQEHYPIYIADGLQRLNATKLIMESPAKYGLGDQKQAEIMLESFSLLIQHRQYKSHEEAYDAFLNLNQGTALKPAEYFKGFLVNNPQFKKWYDVIISHIRKADERISRLPKSSHIADRDALSLFYQYATGHKTGTFWKVAGSTINVKKKQIEQILADWFNETCPNVVEHKISAFKSFIDEQTALIFELMREVRGAGHTMTYTLSHCLLHLCIWRKNTNTPVAHVVELIRHTLRYSPSLNSGITVFDDVGAQKWDTNLGTDDITKLFRLAEVLGLSLEKPTRKRSTAQRGYDRSHINPFSTHGEGPTINEPASLNRARGAKPIASTEQS